jgi:adenine specific DNA methylase Mod
LGEFAVKFLPEITSDKRALILGDNITIMEKLLAKGYREQFKMIYFDGPFNSGLLFTMTNPKFGIEYIQPTSEYQSIREYLDLNLYLENYRKRMELAKELLHHEGFFVLQINQLAGHYVKVLLDQVFGRACFLSEVIWKHSDIPWTLPELGQFGYQHESLFVYSKTDSFHRKDNVYPSVWDDIGVMNK